MKKLLSILGVLSLSSLGINSVIACKGPESSTRKQTVDDNEQTSNDEEQEQPTEAKAPVREEKDEDKTGDPNKRELAVPKRDLRYDISQLSFDNSLWDYKISNIWNYQFDDKFENDCKTEIRNKFIRKLSARSVSIPSESDYKIQKVDQIDHEFSKEFIFSIVAESTSLKIKGQINEIKFNFSQKDFIEFIKYQKPKWTLWVGNNEHVSAEEVNKILTSVKEIAGVSKLTTAGFIENQDYEIRNLDQIQPGDLSRDIILTIVGKQGSVLENLPSVNIILTISDKRTEIDKFEYLSGDLAYSGISNLRAINPSSITSTEADFFCNELKKSIQNSMDKSYWSKSIKEIASGVRPEFGVDYTIDGLEKIKSGAYLSSEFLLTIIAKPESKLLYGTSVSIEVQIQKETRIDISNIKIGPYDWSVSEWEKNKIWQELSGIQNIKKFIRTSISQKISEIAPVVTTPDQNYKITGLGMISRRDTRGKPITITVEALSLVSKHIYGNFSFNITITD